MPKVNLNMTSRLLRSTLLWTSLFLGLNHAAAQAADWPMFQYDATRQGRVAQRPDIQQPKILWAVPIGVAGWLNSPVIADNTVFIGSAGQVWNLPDGSAFTAAKPTDGVYAFDLKTGKLKWQSPAQHDVNQVLWHNGKVIATGDEGAVWALDAQSGKKLWSTALKGSGYQLLAVGSDIIVGDSKGQLLWLNSQNGQVKIRTQLDAAIRAGASSDGQRVFVATTQGTVYAFDNQGKIQWQQSLATFYPELIDASYPVRLEVYGAPTIFKDMLVLSFARDTTYDQPALVALDRQSGKLRWKGKDHGQQREWANIRSSPAVFEDYLIYAEAYSNEVFAIQGDLGQAIGGEKVGAIMFPQWASPAIAGSTVYVPRFDGGLYALDASNGHLKWQFYLGNRELAGERFPKDFEYIKYGEWKPPVGDALYASPALAQDGRILLPAGGYLYCLGEAE